MDLFGGVCACVDTPGGQIGHSLQLSLCSVVILLSLLKISLTKSNI